MLELIRWLVSALFRPRAEGRPAAGLSVREIQEGLDTAESLVLEGELEQAAEALNAVLPQVDAIQGPTGCLLRGWHRLACSEHVARGGAREGIRHLLEEALRELASAPDTRDRADLETRAMAGLGFLAAPDDPDRFYHDHAERAFERAAATERPDALLQVVWTACRMAQLHRQQGHGAEARTCSEAAVALAERLERPGPSAPSALWSARARDLFWSHGRASASSAAVELGLISWSLGEREAAMPWFDRAVGLTDGADLPLARLARSRALLERAEHEPSEPLGDVAARAARYEQAVAEGVACTLPAGRAVAADAEIALGGLYQSVGATDRAAAHLRRVREHLADTPDAVGWPHAARAGFSLGMVLLDAGDHDGARAALRDSLAAGRGAPNPESRHFAALAAHHLHGLLLEREDKDEARQALAALEALVPTLERDARGLVAMLAGRSRAYQALREDRYDDADAAFRTAEEMARNAGPSGARMASMLAADLGDLAHSRKKHVDAAEHFERALGTVVGPLSPAENEDRAELELKHARALMELERAGAARTALKRAYDLGRDSGSASGREAAAIAAMLRGDLAEATPRERREFYEVAARFGRLSGSERGNQVAEAAAQRLKEMAE